MAPSEKNGRLKHFGSVQLLMSFIVGGMLFLFYMWFYVFVLGADLPKTAILKLQNATTEKLKIASINDNLSDDHLSIESLTGLPLLHHSRLR